MAGISGQVFLPCFPTAASFTDQVTSGTLCANQLAAAAGLFSAAGEAPIADMLEGLALLSAGGAPESDGTRTLHENLLRLVSGNPDAVTRALSQASGWKPTRLSVFSPSPVAEMLAAVEGIRRCPVAPSQIALADGFVTSSAPANRPKRDIFHAAGSDDAAEGPADASGAAESAAPSDNAVMEARREKIRALAAMGIPAYPNGIRAENTAKEILESYGTASGDDLEKTPRTVSLAGRIMAIRRLGGAVFMQIQDRTGALQVFVRRDNVSEELFNLQKLFDVGDIALFEGPLVRTKTGELSILAKDLRLVTKSVRPLPEKWHGLTDREIRYRQRYVDLIVNPAVREVFVKRSAVIQAIREYMLRKGFLEVETPMMHPIPGGAAARPFVTHHNALGTDLYMRIAPELYLKRLVVGGLERVFEINRNFRNEGMSPHHNPEFTMMEFYHSYATYRDLMELTEDLLCHAVETATGGAQIEYQGKTIDFSRPFKRYTMKEALAEIGGVPPEVMESAEKARAYAEQNRIEIKTPDASLGTILAEMLGALVEPKLIQPTFITAYPTETSPLSRRNDDDPSIVDRFELFIAGMEIANAFSELNDPADQAARFREQVKARDSGDSEAMHYDSDYVRALEYGMPPTAGEGIGIDRLVMLITNSPSIRDVILFPQMRKE